MKKLYVFAMAAMLGVSAASASIKVTFNNGDNADWNVTTADAIGTVVNGHYEVEMALQGNGKYRADLGFVGEATLNPASETILAVKCIGARPNGNWTTEMHSSSANVWLNSKWKNHHTGSITSTNGNTIYYIDLTQDENYTGGEMTIDKINFKIADCAAEPYAYTLDWIATFANLDELKANADWADDPNDKDEVPDLSKAVLYSSVTGTIYADFESAVSGAADEDVIVINKNVAISDRYTIENKKITFEGADSDVTISRNFNKLIFIIKGGDGNVTFRNLAFDGCDVNGSTAFLETTSYVTFEDVTFKNIKTNHNQGVIAGKGGCHVTLKDVVFENCTIEVPERNNANVFYGYNGHVKIIGDCATASIYVERENGVIDAEDLTNSTPIDLYIDKLGDREMGTALVRGCADRSKFHVVNDGYLLSADAENNNLNIITTDMDAVEVIAADNEAPVYYNLQGRRVDNPANGIYIVRRGSSVSKVIVK